MNKTVVLFSFLIFLSFSALSATAEVNDAEGVPPIEDASFEIFDLDSSTSYTLSAKTSSGLNTITTFSTNNAGDAKVTVDLDPVSRGTQLTDKGYHYQIRKDGSTVDDVYTSYGASVFRYDSFFDGEKNFENFVQMDGTERSTEQDLKLADGSTDPLLQWRMASHQVAIVSVDESDPNSANLRFRNDSHTIDMDSLCSITDYSDTLRIYYNESGSSFEVSGVETGDCGSQSISTVSGLEYFNVGIEGRSTFGEMEIDDWFLAPKNSRNLWYATPESLNITTDSQYNLNDVLRYGNTDASLRYSDNGATFSAFVEDLTISDSFNILNINNETVRPFTFDIREQSPFNNLQPADGAGTTEDTLNISFIWSDYPENDDTGVLSVQFFQNGKWNDVDSRIRSECISTFGNFQEDHQINTGADINQEACEGERIDLEVPIDNFEGEINWRVEYSDNLDLDGTFPTVYSEERTFVRQIQEPNFELNLPIEGSTVTTLKPSFNFLAEVYQSGTIILQLKEDTASSWTNLNDWFIGNKAQRTFSFTPNLALQEKDYDWRIRFDQGTGDITFSEVGNFSINTTKALDTNITLNSPSDNELINSPSIDLNASINSDQPVTTKFYLDGDVVSTREVSSGDNDVSVPLLNLDPDRYSWYVVANNSNVYYQSNIREFEVSEDVNLDLYRPEDEASIERPPILFRANVSTEVAGVLNLYVDNQIRDSQSTQAIQNRTFEFEVRDNISQGRHSWRVGFESLNSGKKYSTSSRTFDLDVGVTGGQLQDTGQFGDSIASAGNDVLGLNRGESLAFFSIFLSMLIGAFIGIETRNSGIAGLSAMFALTGFSIINWFPSWLAISLAVIASFLIASKVTSGRVG